MQHNTSITTASDPVPQPAREIAARLAELFARDSDTVRRLNDAHTQLQDANERLWSGMHPDALAQEIHWTIHRAFVDYQRTSEDRRQLAADVGELTRQLIDALAPAGYSEQQARQADVCQLAQGTVTLSGSTEDRGRS